MGLDERVLIEAATRARQQAYAPYSHYQVGAAVMTAGGLIVAGCNVENASYGLTVCAERNAIFTAIASGHRIIEALAVVTDADEPGMPCGACRQVIQEFAASPEILIVVGNLHDRRLRLTLAGLFPHPFALT
ncbi:MAG: cytidine deaminase [Chloroflexota bacterium]